MSPLFDFDFVSLTSTSGVSRGPYLGGSSSSPKSYIFEASSPTRFTLTVTTPGATPEALPTAITFYGFKKVVVIEKTFLQMYGPFALAAILIAGTYMIIELPIVLLHIQVIFMYHRSNPIPSFNLTHNTNNNYNSLLQ